MPAPRGEYTPARGPLAGQTFPSYFQYQQARAQELGFSGYSEERRVASAPDFKVLEQRLMEVQHVSRFDARAYLAAQPFTRMPRGAGTGRKLNAITFAMYEDLWNTGDDAADDIPY